MSDELEREVYTALNRVMALTHGNREVVPVVVALIEEAIRQANNHVQLREEIARGEWRIRAEKAEKDLAYIKNYMEATKANAEDHLKLRDRDPSMCETVIMCMDDLLGEME